MASIWDTLFPQTDYRTKAQGGYADLYANGLLGSRTDTPRSVEAMRSSQDFVPVLGDVLAFGEAGNALAKGDRKTAAIMAGAGLLGLVPGVGDALARPVMAAGRKGAELARRIEVDPNAMGSMGGNVRLGAGDWAREGMSVPELIAASRKRLADRDAAVSSAAMTDAPLRMKTDGGMNALVSRSPDVEGGWRITYMGEDGVPNGHVDASDKSSAVRRAMEDGFNAPATLPTPRTDAEAMAKQVLEMRAAGNAGNVTDDMMAMADDPYMFNNTPLDMSAEGRMGRAGDAGFDTGTSMYHGSDRVFDGFDNAAEKRTDHGWYGDGTYFGNPATASVYAKGDASESTVRGSVYPAVSRGRRMDWPEGQSPAMNAQEASDISKNVGDLGYTGIDKYYPNEPENYGSVAGQLHETNVFDPRNIRSQYARFDPAFKHLRNLSAGVAGVGLLSQADQRQQRRGLLE